MQGSVAWQDEIQNALDITSLHFFWLIALIRLHQFVNNYMGGLYEWNVVLC